jgi:hypothetical protein
MAYDVKLGNSTFKMGASIKEVGAGDAVKIGSQVEIIKEIKPLTGSSWDHTITTESGHTVTMFGVNAYGKKVE